MTTALIRIRAAIEDMPEALSRIGKYVLDNPDKVLRSSLDEVAAFSQSGQASVIRFCRLLGYRGFADFKLNLAADLAHRQADALAPRQQGSALAAQLTASMTATAQGLDPATVEALAQRLKTSRRIDIFGGGISGMVASMLSYRLQRLGLVAQAYQDPLLAHEIMVGLDSGCTAIAVSETGVTPATLQFQQAAKSAGVYTAAVTSRAASPLARRCDLALITVPVDPPPVNGQLGAAFAKLLVVETLASAIARS
ncbi:MurR/RpiR family transcriptional regulator [Telmatospirillum sp. J64-1]|uniref:MurR/RpiR family transcriptional regulator n=1 Tax=Telmatospirillum sp. J64-1 TaxID=2502183 RepID=UPI00115E85A7|nr:MurR/RpiR family transcriptional regulator [Telmatospirillum sp. J64-1]